MRECLTGSHDMELEDGLHADQVPALAKFI